MFEVQDKKTFAMLKEDYHWKEDLDLSIRSDTSDAVFRSNVIDVQDNATKFLIVPPVYLERNDLTEFPTFIEHYGRFELFSISMTKPEHTWSWVHLKKNDTKLWYNLDDLKSRVVSQQEKPKGDAKNKIHESVGVYVKSKEYDSLIYPIVEPSPPSQTIDGGAVAEPDGAAIGQNDVQTDGTACRPDGIDVQTDGTACRPDGVASTSWELEFFRAFLIFALIRL